MNIAIIGLGLIGGSIARCLKKNTPHTVLGMDIDPQVIYKARLLDAIDNELTDERLGICDMVILATWPRAAVEYVQTHADLLKPGAMVMDVCGVKQAVCQPLWALAQEKGFRFVGGHPMAGIEYSGFSHSKADLFQNASMILVPPKGMDIQTVANLKHFWHELGFARVVITTAENHDRMIAYTSQLAHVLSSAYVQSPTALEHFGFSAGSFKDLSRVARLNEDMWTELFFENQGPLLHEVDTLIDNLTRYRDALRDGDTQTMHDLLKEGRIRKAAADSKEDQ